MIGSIGKTKRKKKEDENEEITYINERNKVFNKKVRKLCKGSCQTDNGASDISIFRQVHERVGVSPSGTPNGSNAADYRAGYGRTSSVEQHYRLSRSRR